MSCLLISPPGMERPRKSAVAPCNYPDSVFVEVNVVREKEKGFPVRPAVERVDATPQAAVIHLGRNGQSRGLTANEPAGLARCYLLRIPGATHTHRMSHLPPSAHARSFVFLQRCVLCLQYACRRPLCCLPLAWDSWEPAQGAEP